MRNSNKYNVAVIGATGSTGRETVKMLEERNFPVENLFAIASEKSIGQEITFKNKNIKVQHLEDINFSEIQLAFSCAGDAFSRKYAESVTSQGCVIIDKSSYFRLNPKVPLIVPEVNLKTLHKGAPLGIVSTPNCIVTPLALALKALSEISPLKRAVVSTYQSVSGAGIKAIDELYAQTKGIISALNGEPVSTAVNLRATDKARSFSKTNRVQRHSGDRRYFGFRIQRRRRKNRVRNM